MLKKLLESLFIVGWVNSFVFFVTTMVIGGIAMNGKVVGGHYYVADHNIYTEVSRSVFLFSKVYTYCILVTHPLAMIAGLLHWILFNKKAKQPAS